MINEEMLKKIRFQCYPYRFYYIRDEQEYELNSEPIDGSNFVFKLEDSDGIWTPDDYCFGLKRRYTLRTYQCLFGEEGVACNNATLGLAVVWTSGDSKQRGVITVGEITNSQKDLEFELNYEFKEAQLRGEVEFTTIIYIKSAGTPLGREEHLANEYGCILGELDKFTIMLDGNGSMFPMYEVYEPSQPLWYAKCEWDDPTYESFNECVSVFINKAHKNYKYLDKTKRTFDEQLLKEIIASALMLVITKLKQEDDYWEESLIGNDLKRGSVSEAVYYFVNTLEWDVSSMETLSLSIRKFLDQRL
ncbi:hypothetical protein [Lachnospira multipara]|uniref:hypothetical protein n=1 Tax=Lachnospira multipara TaxID=28051 RepID=UPI001FA6DF0A|nr:hypothetical protein [Lachnospira multipara]